MFTEAENWDPGCPHGWWKRATRTWERRRMQPETPASHPRRARPLCLRDPPPLPTSHRTPRKPRGGQGKGEPGEAAARELVPPSLAGGDARAANRAKPRIEVQTLTRRSVCAMKTERLGERERGERTRWRQGPSSPRRTPRALHLEAGSARLRPSGESAAPGEAAARRA